MGKPAVILNIGHPVKDPKRVAAAAKAKATLKAKKAAKTKKAAGKKGKKGAKKGAKKGSKKGSGTTSPYILFVKEARADVIKKNPKLTFGEVGKELGKLWKALSADKKKKYQAAATSAKAKAAK